MSTPQPYPAPPIIDAIVELRLKMPLERRDLTRIVKAYRAGYDTHEETGEVDVEVRIERGDIKSKIGPAKPVHVFSNSDQTDFSRVEVSKLHWSRLPPYEGWPALQSRVLYDLDSLPKKLGLPPLERIGVRYRNRIDVPVGPDDVGRYEDYLLVNISLPPLLDPHDGYQWKIEKHFRDRGLGATVLSGIMQSELPRTIAVLLDIDVYMTSSLPSDKKGLAEKLGELRALKNEIFEACVTDKARASFQ